MRYIDADALLENLKKQYGEELGWQVTVNMSDVGMMIEDAPTADVVPKSAVERLQEEADRYKRYFYRHDYDEMIAEAKAEVAREIFEEIEKYSEVAFAMGDYHTPIYGIGMGVFAALKKKYTEEKGG